MRWKEMRDGESTVLSHESYRVCVALTSPLTRHLHRPGISVYPPSNPETGRPDNTVLGKSSIAGTYAVGQTAASRVLTNMCVRDLRGSPRVGTARARALMTLLPLLRSFAPALDPARAQPDADPAAAHHDLAREARRLQPPGRSQAQHRHPHRCVRRTGTGLPCLLRADERRFSLCSLRLSRSVLRCGPSPPRRGLLAFRARLALPSLAPTGPLPALPPQSLTPRPSPDPRRPDRPLPPRLPAPRHRRVPFEGGDRPEKARKEVRRGAVRACRVQQGLVDGFLEVCMHGL